MNLADHIVAATGTDFDVAGIMTSIGHFIRKSERFEMSDDVVNAAAQLVDSKPSTLLAALPMCRLPYENMWIEYRGGINKDNNKRDPKKAPIPDRQGFLIESDPNTGGQVGFATVAWFHKKLPDKSDTADAPFASPFSIYFDWRKDADVRDLIRRIHHACLKEFAPNEKSAEHMFLVGIIKWIEHLFLGKTKEEEVRRFFMLRHGWEQFANDPKEIEAMRLAENHMLAGLSPHGIRLLLQLAEVTFVRQDPESCRTMLNEWLADIQGEGVFLECFLAMLNSRNCIENEVIDLSRLNKARHKRGKPPLLDYVRTKITLSRSQRRVAGAQGMDREKARQHLVRGHFKIRINRRTGVGGVFWWSPFLRGDPSRPLTRKQYEVT